MRRLLDHRSTDVRLPDRAGSLARRATLLVHDSAGAYFRFGTWFQDQTAGERIDRLGLRGYYCDFSHKAAPREREPGGSLAGVFDGGPVRSPMVVAQAALGFWERYVAGEPVVDQFLVLSDWLMKNAKSGKHGTVWSHDVAVPKYDVAPGWISGMTQGEAISVLLRAHLASGEARYRDAALDAFGPFTADVQAGGVTRDLDGAFVIEEYPTATPTAVLNGWIFGLLGLHELRVATGDERVDDLFMRSRAGLLSVLDRYDAGWWSRYSLRDHGRPDLAKPFYQRLHAVLLDAVDLVEPDARLAAMARRWERQITRPAMVRIALNKTAFRIYRELSPQRP